MIRTLKLKLPLIDGQKASVLRTMGAYTRAFEIAAQWGYQNRNANKFAMHKGVYYTIRQEFLSCLRRWCLRPRTRHAKR